MNCGSGILVSWERESVRCDVEVEMGKPEVRVRGGYYENFRWGCGGLEGGQEGMKFGEKGVGNEVYWWVGDC